MADEQSRAREDIHSTGLAVHIYVENPAHVLYSLNRYECVLHTKSTLHWTHCHKPVSTKIEIPIG